MFIDGFLPGAIATTPTPALDRLLERAAVSLEARAESTTISGSGWSSFLTGVHWDKHGVPDNAFEAPRFDRYRHVIALLQEARPDAVTASAQSWRPIEEGLVLPAEPDHTAFHDYYAYSDDYWDEASCDALCAADLARVLATVDVDLAVVMFGELDGVGHTADNAHYDAADPLYQKMLARIDGHLSALLDAIAGRDTYAGEDWLVIVSTDHAGARGEGHGRNVPSHRRVPFLVSGAAAAPGPIWPPPQTVDVVPTALRHLGVALRPEWDLDGVPVGLPGTTAHGPPEPRLGVELLFGGDAEHERGFAHSSGAPDASVAGWDDPGALTVLAYGAGDGFPTAEDPGPPDRGRNFFAGGGAAADSWMSQTLDVGALVTEANRAGLELGYTLGAWLGGYAGQEDGAALTATFLDGAGAPLGSARLGPVGAAERGGRTGLWHRSSRGPVPPGTRRVEVRLDAYRHAGSNDGYADNLSLVLEARGGSHR